MSPKRLILQTGIKIHIEQRDQKISENTLNLITAFFHIESAIRNVFRKYQNDRNGEIPLPETLKRLLDIEIKKIQSVRPKETTLFEYRRQDNRISGKKLQ